MNDEREKVSTLLLTSSKTFSPFYNLPLFLHKKMMQRNIERTPRYHKKNMKSCGMDNIKCSIIRYYYQIENKLLKCLIVSAKKILVNCLCHGSQRHMYKYGSLVFSAGSEFRKLNTKVSGKIVVILGLTSF